MKVELDNIILGHSPLTDNVFAGIPKNSREWKYKKNVTDSFIACVISRWENQSETLVSGKDKWIITVRKMKP